MSTDIERCVRAVKKMGGVPRSVSASLSYESYASMSSTRGGNAVAKGRNAAAGAGTAAGGATMTSAGEAARLA